MLASRCGKRKENSDDKRRGETPTTRRSSIVLWIFSVGLSAERWRKQVLSAAAPEILQVSARRDRAFFCCVSSFLGSGVDARQRLLARHGPVSTPRHRVPPGSSSSPPTSASEMSHARKSQEEETKGDRTSLSEGAVFGTWEFVSLLTSSSAKLCSRF